MLRNKARDKVNRVINSGVLNIFLIDVNIALFATAPIKNPRILRFSSFFLTLLPDIGLNRVRGIEWWVIGNKVLNKGKREKREN